MQLQFESLNSKKFAPLTKEDMLLVRGGEDTKGGSEVMGTWTFQTPCEGQSGGVEYHEVTMSKIHSWTSDAVDEAGRTCLWGEGYGWVDPK